MNFRIIPRHQETFRVKILPNTIFIAYRDTIRKHTCIYHLEKNGENLSRSIHLSLIRR